MLVIPQINQEINEFLVIIPIIIIDYKLHIIENRDN